MSGLHVRVFSAGRFRVPQRWVVPQGHLRVIEVPDLFALIDHPIRGMGLFDTGCSELFNERTGSVSLEGYREFTRLQITPEETARNQLERAGVHASDIRWVVLSHLDADHTGGLRDFPGAEIYLSAAALEIATRGGVRAALAGRLFPRHLPDDFAARARAVPEDGPPVGKFPWSHDLFGEGTVRVVPMPGHAVGHIGALVRTDNDRTLVFCGDAVWSRAGLAERGVFHEGIAVDRRALMETRRALAQLVAAGDGVLVPSHCPVAAAELLQNP